ncbi:MAG: hypothetical protein J0I06_12450 [Planctomycetes bacterium]|nr:hypothetical protein [Planctomycetota bacterium]
MNRLLRSAALAAALVAPCAGCGDSGKPAEPKVTGGNVDPNLKRATPSPQGGGGTPQPAGKGAPRSSASPN